MCPGHWALVPKTQQLRSLVTGRAFRRALRGTHMRTLAYRAHVEECVRCVEVVLLALWEMGFPWPPTHRQEARDCACPLCEQARRVAPKAYGTRRWVDTARAQEEAPATE